MDLGVSGLASGFDWRSLVDQLAQVERAPQQTLLADQSKIEQQSTDYGAIRTQLQVLQNKVTVLNDPTLFGRRLSTVGDSTVMSATATSGAPLGSYNFNIGQLATSAVQVGIANLGAKLSPSNDVSSLVLSDAAFSTAVTAGTFAVNGKQVTIATTDSLQDVFDKISTATGGTVTGSYDSLTDKISLTSAGEIILGSATDTSNFLSAAGLQNNGTGTVTSGSSLGSVKKSLNLAAGNFNTAITDGGAGAGEFKINGVSISFDAGTDSLQNVIDRINSSTAGVTASYDPVNDRLTLTNKATGDLGIGLEDVTGNFLAATGLSGGSLTRGKNLEYSINNGGTLTSTSNTITEASSGISGLSVTALKMGTSTVDVSSDTAAIKTAINDFLDAYNTAQSMIDTDTASRTDSKGVVTAGSLAGQSDANEIASKLRGLSFSAVSGLSGAITGLASLGIQTNGNDNKLALSDSQTLDDALANHLDQVTQMFTASDNGLAVRLNSYLDNTAGDDGSLATRISNLGKQSVSIDDQVAAMERQVQADRQRMIDSFTHMETAQAQINQQLQYLSKIG